MNNYITWLYFLVENQSTSNEKVIFLYGLSLPTNCKKYNIKITSETIEAKKQIVVFSKVDKTPLSVENNSLNFNGFIKSEKTPLKIMNYKEIIQVANGVSRDIPNSLLTSPLYTKCFYTGEFYGYLDEQSFESASIEPLMKILEVLENMSGQKFTSNYSKRLGCYEIGHPQEWMEEKATPFLVDTQKQEETLKYVLKIDESYIFEQVTIHLMVYNNDNEIVKDFIKSINANNRNIFLAEIEKKDSASLEYWIFDENGKLIDKNKYGFIRSISLNTSLVGKTYDINSSNYSNKSPLKEDKNRSISTYTQGFQNNIEVDKTPDIEEKANKLYQRLKTYKEEDTFYKNGVWFNIGEHNRIIKFLNKITLHGAYKVIFIDPFISKDSLDYLYYFENKQISMQFISCWKKDISPDDSEEKKATADSINEVQQRLRNIEDFNIPLKTTSWYNFKGGKFHDRFIYIENVSTAEKQVYSLSNSLNNMLKDYNLLVTPLKGEVLQKALNYLDGLFLECMDKNKIYPLQENSYNVES